jgi:hypothetical protein
MWHFNHDFPKNGKPFTVQLTTLPWPVQAIWNAHYQEICVPVIQACPLENGSFDSFFENTWCSKSEVYAWTETAIKTTKIKTGGRHESA